MGPKGKSASCKTNGSIGEDKAHIPLSFLECLEVIYTLSQTDAVICVDSICKKMGLNKDLIMERISGLQEIGFVEIAHFDKIQPEKIQLTAAGKKTAIGIIRKQRLLEIFLTDFLKLPWEGVHEEARRLSMVMTDNVGERLAKFLKHPKTCPHGNPIPSHGGILHAENAMPLHKLGLGKKGIILRIEKEEPEVLKYLASLGLFPQTKVEVEEKAPFGGPVIVKVGTSRYALGRKVASKIFVKEG